MMSEVNDTDPEYIDDGDSGEQPPAEWESQLEDEDIDTEVGNDDGEDDSGDDVGAPA